MFDSTKFFNNLNSLMTARHISKQELSNVVGVSRQAISKIANGKNLLTMDKLAIIADFFAVSVDYLMGRNDDPQYEFYLQKAEDSLLEGMPEPFIKIFKYCKAKGLKKEVITPLENWQLLRWFEEWKHLSLEMTMHFDKESTYKEKYMRDLNPEEKTSRWKQLGIHLYGEFFDGVGEYKNPFINRSPDLIDKERIIKSNLAILIDLDLYCFDLDGDIYLTAFPDPLVEYLYLLTEDDMKHPERRK
jgi:transcriptional regulator with XRE-family HTH domain